MSRVINTVVVVTGYTSTNEHAEPQYEYAFHSYGLALAFTEAAKAVTKGDVAWSLASYSAEVKGSIWEDIADLRKEWAELTGDES